MYCSAARGLLRVPDVQLGESAGHGRRAVLQLPQLPRHGLHLALASLSLRDLGPPHAEGRGAVNAEVAGLQRLVGLVLLILVLLLLRVQRCVQVVGVWRTQSNNLVHMNTWRTSLKSSRLRELLDLSLTGHF